MGNRKRVFLNGLGIGIILGAVLLELMGIGEAVSRPSFPIEAEQQSGSVENEASRSNEASSALQYTEEELQARLEALRAQLEAEYNDRMLESDASTSSADEADEAGEADRLVRIVRIPSGMTLEQVSVLLVDFGLISDASSFITAMERNSSKIRSGTFYFEGRPTESEVMATILKDPSYTMPR